MARDADTQKTTTKKSSRKVVKRKPSEKKKSPGRKKSPKAKKVSRTKKPGEMSLDDWQIALRRQYGREQDFNLKNTGDEKFFSEFHVTNAESGNTYRVAIRGTGLGENFCSCPDFATNSLGTCKHVEFTLAKLNQKRGGKKAFNEGFQPEYSEIFLMYGSERRVCFRPGSECPQELARLGSNYFDDEGVLKEDAFSEVHTFLTDAAGIEHSLRVYDDALEFIARVRDREDRARRLDEMFPAGADAAAFADLVKVPLYEYQREGALFAARAGRCLIGDEMGLGKTIQAIAAAEMLARVAGVERVLVVSPTSLKHQWLSEIEKFTDRTAAVVGGRIDERAECYKGDEFFKIVNYDVIHRDLEEIERLAPDLVILDEAQRIKNWDTRTAQSVKKIESPYAVVLTGTPLENRLEELVSIVQFVDQHRLGPTFRFLHEHQIHDDTGRVVGYQKLDEVGRTLEPILLRRQKSQVLDQLPGRIDQNIFVPMDAGQQNHHEENAATVAKIVQKWRRHGFLTESDQRRLMIALQYMRMSCDSSYLIDEATEDGQKAGELVTLLDELFERPDTKVVVFSQWLRMHELSLKRLGDNGRDWEHVYFHGGVPSKKRKGLIDRFQEDPDCRVFLATDAGGVGLNLQKANVVVNMDLPWNPAVLEQRIGRVHRLGQTQPVQVVNFVAENTIEHNMLSVLAFKQSLASGVLDGGETDVFLGGSRLTKFIESVERVTTNASLNGASRGSVDGASGNERAGSTQETSSNSSDGRSANLSDAQPQSSSATASNRPVAVENAASNPWAGLLQNGLAILEQLAASTNIDGSSSSTARPASQRSAVVQTIQDESDGRQYLKLPMPEPEMIQNVLRAVTDLLERTR